jgi:hypothetical protein
MTVLSHAVPVLPRMNHLISRMQPTCMVPRHASVLNAFIDSPMLVLESLIDGLSGGGSWDQRSGRKQKSD